MIVFRMHGVRYDVFDTTGAFLQPGRWHPAGVRVIYTAEYASLAVLETLIHAGGRKLPPRSMTRIEIPDDLTVETTPWMDIPASQEWGARWVAEQRGAVLKVPSIAVNRMESNFVLNPLHPQFSRIRHEPAEEFVFNVRLFALS